MTDKVLRLLFGLFVGVYVARYLGPERFGLLSFAMSFVAILGAFANLGLNGIVVRNAVLHPESKDELLGTAFGLRLVGGLVLIGIVSVAIHFTDSDPLTRVLVIIIAVGYFLQAFQVIEFYFHSLVLVRLASIGSISGLIASSTMKLVLIWSGASLVWFAWAFVIDHAVKGLVFCIMYVKQRISLGNWRFQIDQAKILIKDSWPLMLSGFAVMIYMRIDQVMIKMMLDNASVGNYAVAVKLSELWYFVPVAISQSLFPAILLAKKKNQELYVERVQGLFDLIVFLSIIFALPLSLFSSQIICVLFGESYANAHSVLRIHAWAGVFVGLNNAAWRWHMAENNQKLAFFRLLAGALLNILLNYYLIPAMNIV
ncbi:MAG: flippase, partial [Desulfobacteraceae bacterium]|nr:flippase [Desulfobacteraceae bacterium]